MAQEEFLAISQPLLNLEERQAHLFRYLRELGSRSSRVIEWPGMQSAYRWHDRFHQGLREPPRAAGSEREGCANLAAGYSEQIWIKWQPPGDCPLLLRRK
jgi:hypothetical protein